MKFMFVAIAFSLVPSIAQAEPRALLSQKDYPREAISRHEKGIVRVKLHITADGRVSSCAIVQSASPALDAATCRILTMRARFAPAKDNAGKAIESDLTAPPIRWVLPPAPPPKPPEQRRVRM